MKVQGAGIITNIGIGLGEGEGVTLQKFYMKFFFYMMGKVLSGELSCMQTGLVSECTLAIPVNFQNFHGGDSTRTNISDHIFDN